MERANFETLDAKEATDILVALSKAWETRDCSAIQRLSDRLPDGYAFAVFAPKQGSPCFSIVTATGFACEIPEGYTYIPDHQLLVASISVEATVGSKTAIEKAGDTGLQGNLELEVEKLNDKS